MQVTQAEVLISPLKWAGGKRWLVHKYRHFLPSEFKRYFEPFLGGASVFLMLEPNEAILSDANAELIDMYSALRDDWEKVIDYLQVHSAYHSNDYYYSQRAAPPQGRYARAAWFLYMNRACYNGLYRVNRKGEFNVPKGTKEDIFLGTDDFESVSEALNSAQLLTVDFEKVVDLSRRGDFVYADPPYTVKHNNNGFVKYNEQIFSWSDQERLAVAVKRAADRGVKIAVSNANHSTILDLYRDFGQIIEVSRHSTIGGKLASRAAVSEVLIKVGY